MNETLFLVCIGWFLLAYGLMAIFLKLRTAYKQAKIVSQKMNKFNIGNELIVCIICISVLISIYLK